MKFKSAVDRWYYFTIVASILIIVGVVFPAFSSGQMSLVEAVILSFVLALPIWLLISTYYKVSDELLIVRTGVFTWKIKLKDIHSVKSSRSLLSSPALSLNRLKVSYNGNKSVLVSPKNVDEFLRAIGHGE